MGGGRAMATAAKVAGIGVGKGGFKGFGFPPATEQFRVKTAAAAASSKPVSASITSAVHPSVEEDGMIMQRPVWDDWEFAEEEPIPRVVFSKPPSLEEAKEATEDLKEAINLVYMSSPKSSAAMEGSNDGGSVSKMLSGFQSSENRAVESAVPQVALQAFAFLSENTAAQTVVASIASDPKVWDAVMENKDLMKFLQTNKTAVSSQVESDNDDQSERSSTTECEVVETKVRFASKSLPKTLSQTQEIRTREMWKYGLRIAAGNAKLNRKSSILNNTVCHFSPPTSAAVGTLFPSLDHVHRCFSSSKSTKSSITKTKKSEGKKSKPKGGDPGAAGAEEGEFGAAGGDDLEAGRAKRLADDEKIPSLDVGPNGRPLFTPKDTTLSQLTHKDIGSYFKFDEAALKAVLPEGLASGIEDEFNESWRPALLVRKSYLALRDNFRRIADPPMWPSDSKGVKLQKQIVLDGPVKCGKSIALAMLVHWARDEGWLVLYAPKGRDWTHGGYFYKNPHTGFWDTPLQAENILKDFVKFNESRLRELRCKIHDPIVLGEGAGVGYLKGADAMPIPEDSTLYDLVQMGIKSTHAAVNVVVRLRKELSVVKDVPVLIVIDQYNSWFTFSEFEEPVTPRSCRPIHARELTTVNAFRSMMHEDMMVGAFSHSTAVGKLRKDLPDVPVDARQQFPRYSLDEAEAVCYYYLRQRLVRREVFNEENWKKIYYLANGNGAEMRWLAPFMR